MKVGALLLLKVEISNQQTLVLKSMASEWSARDVEHACAREQVRVGEIRDGMHVCSTQVCPGTHVAKPARAGHTCGRAHTVA